MHNVCTRIDWVLSPLSDWTQVGLWASFQRESRNWTCECGKGTGQGIGKRGFLPQPCCYPIVWPWKFISSFLGLDIPICRMGAGSDLQGSFLLTHLPFGHNVCPLPWQLLKALSTQKLTQKRESTWKLLGEYELSIFLKAVEFLEIFSMWYLFSLRFHKLFHLHTLTYMWPVLKSNHEHEGQA